MTNPRVSVVMSTLNNGVYLRQAIDSILSQTWKDFEFIIINDGSIDDTANIIASYDGERIIYVENEKPMTLPVALNQGLAIARGEFIARMDSDDIALPQRLEKQVDYLESHSETGILGTQYIQIDEHGNQQRGLALPISHNLIIWRLFTGFALLHPSVMVRQSILKKAGGYDEQFPVSQDRELYIRCLPHTQFANLPETLMYYRVHPQSSTKRKSGTKQDLSFLPAQKFFQDMTHQSIDVSTIKRTFQRNYLFSLHSYTEVQASTLYLLQVFQILVEQRYLQPDDLTDVYTDIGEIILGMGRQSPQGFSYVGHATKAVLKWLIRR